MKCTVQALDDNRVKVSVDIDDEEFEERLEQAFRKLAKQVRLPGFRAGKAPRKVLEARFGMDVARGEALNDAVPEFYALALDEQDVDAIAPPEINITSGTEEDAPVSFDAVVEIRPQVNIAGYDGLRVEVPVPEATEEEVTQQLDLLRKQFGELEDVARSAIDGDHVTMDVHCTYNGEEVEGLTVDDYTYEVGSGTVVAEIDEELRGASTGAILEFNAPHPDPDSDGLLRFRVLVKNVQKMVLPDMDDEFAREASEFDTAEELKEEITSSITGSKRAQALTSLHRKSDEQLAELVLDDIPEALITTGVQQRVQMLALRLAEQGVELEQWLEATGQTLEKLTEELREPAQQDVRTDLALRAVAVAESIEVDEADVAEELALLAGQIGQDPDKVRTAFESDGRMKAVRFSAQMRKTRDWLLDHVEIVTPDGARIQRADLEPDPDPETDEDAE